MHARAGATRNSIPWIRYFVTLGMRIDVKGCGRKKIRSGLTWRTRGWGVAQSKTTYSRTRGGVTIIVCGNLAFPTAGDRRGGKRTGERVSGGRLAAHGSFVLILPRPV